MREELGKTIDDKEYRFLQMVPEDAVRVSLRLMKIAGLQVGGALGALKLEPGGAAAKGDFDLDMKLLGVSIGKMFQQINEEETIDTMKKMLTSVLFNGTPLKMDHSNFQGKTLHLFKVVTESGRVNFSDFFAGSSGIVGKLKEAMSTMLERQTSTGHTGD